MYGMSNDAVLDEIRRAAFELRLTDPQEAVRVLRRAANKGGEAEVLARGALGEIYLEELGDLDGAEHEFRRVLQLVPGLAAAELGLARTLRESGDWDEAEQRFASCLATLLRDARGFRGEEELPEGAEEVVLTALETAIELARLRHEIQGDGEPRVDLDEELVRWAADARIFDSDDGDEDDWARFYGLWTELLLLGARSGAALKVLSEAEADERLSPAQAARLKSDIYEELGDKPNAGSEARRSLEALEEPWPVGDVVRAGALLGPSGRDLLERALTDVNSRLPAASGDEREELDAEAAALREALGTQPVVGLGKRR
jgi:tetratricopeptide (TPR) repeat protein